MKLVERWNDLFLDITIGLPLVAVNLGVSYALVPAVRERVHQEIWGHLPKTAQLVLTRLNENFVIAQEILFEEDVEFTG